MKLVQIFTISLLLTGLTSLDSDAVDGKNPWSDLNKKGDHFERGEVGFAPQVVKFDKVPSERQVASLKAIQTKASGEDDKRLLAILRFKPASTTESRARKAFSEAFAYQSRKEFEKAIPLYADAIKENPFLFEADYNSGLCNQAAGKLDKAIACYRMALTISPSNSTCTRRLAEAYHSSGDEQRALRYLKQYFEN